MKPASAKAKGSKLERHVAGLLGGKRSPLSGAVGGGDVWVPSGIWTSWLIECKQRKALPHLVSEAFLQAEAASTKMVGSRRKPMVVIREDRGRAIACFWLEDIVAFCEELAGMPGGYAIKGFTRQIVSLAEQIEKAASA